MKILKSLKPILSGLSNFIKKKSSLFLFIIILPNNSFALTDEQHKFVNQINYCLTQLYKRIPENRHIDKDRQRDRVVVVVVEVMVVMVFACLCMYLLKSTVSQNGQDITKTKKC